MSKCQNLCVRRFAQAFVTNTPELDQRLIPPHTGNDVLVQIVIGEETDSAH